MAAPPASAEALRKLVNGADSARLILYHKQATSARTRFLRLGDTICAFGGLPPLAQVLDGSVPEPPPAVVLTHPAPLAAGAERGLGLPAGSVCVDGEFRLRVDVPAGPLTIYLAQLTTIDPPFAAAEAAAGRFVDLTQARDLAVPELELLRHAYVCIMEG